MANVDHLIALSISLINSTS